jgi:hypothetical protein
MMHGPANVKLLFRFVYMCIPVYKYVRIYVLYYVQLVYTTVKFYMTKIVQKAHIWIFILLYLLQTEVICKVTPQYD